MGAQQETERSKRRSLGQYFTPPDVAAFVLDAARLVLDREPSRLLDPACGDGVFLRTALARGVVAREGAFGIELDPALAGRARSRLALGANIICADALAGGVSGRYDIVVANPPFGGGGGRGRLELRFAARLVEFLAPRGAAGVILPEGFFANASSQGMRDALLESAEPLAVVELPPEIFRSSGARARTCALVLREGRAAPGSRCLIARLRPGESPAVYYESILRALRGDSAPPPSRRVSASDLRGHRWDPRWWLFAEQDILGRAKVPLVRLGEFIDYITYGPIVTREREARSGTQARAPAGASGDVLVVGLRELRPAGLDLRRARRVPAGSVHDPPRARLAAGDIVLARSGMGSLLKGRVAVFGGGCRATVNCFVDLVRLRGRDAGGIEPGYAALCLRSRIVRQQVERLASGVGTPNLSFRAIRGLFIPRLGERLEREFAEEEARARALYERELAAGGEGRSALLVLDEVVAALENAALG